MDIPIFDVAVIGGGPAGATAAADLARSGRSVLLLDRDGRIKPCGGAIPPKLIEEFAIPDRLLVARITSARMVSPRGRNVDMPINGGFVGMVDREEFDEWLRQRAVDAGATRVNGTFVAIERDDGAGVGGATDSIGPAGSNASVPSAGSVDGAAAIVRYRTNASPTATGDRAREGVMHAVRARAVIGADGAASAVAKQEIPGSDRIRYVYAYHEIVRVPAPDGSRGYDARRCDVHYQGPVSPDFYGWIFPHGETASIGTGTALRGFSLRSAVADLRAAAGLSGAETIRREGAPIPMRPLRRWDNGRDVVLAGDAAGVVAPASGEGIYYAMTGGRLAARAVETFLATGDARALRSARREFLRAHGRVFWILGIMQRFWYASDRRRERFVSICSDPDVQDLTWQAYMHKKLVRAKPLAHARIFVKDLAHLAGIVRP